MSKIAQYLNEHILGDVTTDASVRKQLSRDASQLAIVPEIVVYPRVTNDIRKVVRFTYQLAEKGHAISVTARGSGSDQTGAAITDGILVNTTAHMNNIFEFDSKQLLVRVQPGVTISALNSALRLQGYNIPALPTSATHGTIGGAVANNASGRYSGKFGAIEEYVEQLEVVLANGDVIQTKRLSKRELNKKKGLQTLEGEIYRAVDNLIDDNQAFIEDNLGNDTIDNSGYRGLSRVKQKNGSFDLTPLFIGAQGTLGIISEMILRAEYYNNNESIAALTMERQQDLLDVCDELRRLDPNALEVISADVFERAIAQGKKYALVQPSDGEAAKFAGVVICTFGEFSERTRKRKIKKITKLAQKFNALNLVTTEQADTQLDDIKALRGAVYASLQADIAAASIVSPLFSGVYIPIDRFEDFLKSLGDLAKAHKITMPYSGYALENVYNFYPHTPYRTVTDKQKLLKLYDEFVAVVRAHGGSVVAEAGEGRIKSPFIRHDTDKDLAKLYADLRAIFDSQKTMNVGVKQPVELRTVVVHLQTTFDTLGRGDVTGE